jgi:hypothetical protein
MPLTTADLTSAFSLHGSRPPPSLHHANYQDCAAACCACTTQFNCDIMDLALYSAHVCKFVKGLHVTSPHRLCDRRGLPACCVCWLCCRESQRHTRRTHTGKPSSCCHSVLNALCCLLHHVLFLGMLTDGLLLQWGHLAPSCRCRSAARKWALQQRRSGRNTPAHA